MMKTVKKLLLILLGNFMIALGVSHFLMPAGLVAGGATGLALALNRAFGLSMTVCVWGLSLAFFVWCYASLGKRFALSILVSTVAYPLFFSLTSLLAQRFGTPTDDAFLCTAFTGICFGVGIGLVMRAGASTGGSDVVALVLNRRFGFSVQTTLYLFDGVILCLQIPFSRPEQVLYGLLSVLVYTYIIGKVMLFGQDKVQVLVYSAAFEDINRVILSEYDRGSTLLHAEGGYGRTDIRIVQTVIPRRSLFSLRERLLSIDPKAFIVINPVSEVNGRGFTLEKHA